jgi:hypothetical protein
MRPILAIDLGAAPVLAAVMGTERAPILLEVRRFTRWDTEEITAAIAEIMERRGIREVYVEETFTWRGRQRRYLADVGRKQEAQAGFLEGWLFGRGELRRVSPVNDAEAYAAWCVFGRPEEAGGEAGRHLRDALGIGLKALIGQRELALNRGGER